MSTSSPAPRFEAIALDGKWEFNRISRRNQERTLAVEVRHEYLKAPELLAAAQPLIEELNLDAEYHWEVGGELKDSGETNEKLFRYLPQCLFGIIILLIWQFNSFRRPLIIMLTIPLAFVGAFIGIFVFQAPFDFFGTLGLLSLAGVIINNGIVLIDRIDTEQQEGLEPYDAIIAAALSRLRPINMTTITTILGLLPTYCLGRSTLLFPGYHYRLWLGFRDSSHIGSRSGSVCDPVSGASPK